MSFNALQKVQVYSKGEFKDKSLTIIFIKEVTTICTFRIIQRCDAQQSGIPGIHLRANHVDDACCKHQHGIAVQKPTISTLMR